MQVKPKPKLSPCEPPATEGEDNNLIKSLFPLIFAEMRHSLSGVHHLGSVNRAPDTRPVCISWGGHRASDAVLRTFWGGARAPACEAHGCVR